MDYVFEFEGLEFEWDTNKALSNYRKHGVTFEVAAQVFLDPFHVVGDASANQGCRRCLRESRTERLCNWQLL
jgi:uncharacterized protein